MMKHIVSAAILVGIIFVVLGFNSDPLQFTYNNDFPDLPVSEEVVFDCNTSKVMQVRGGVLNLPVVSIDGYECVITSAPDSALGVQAKRDSPLLYWIIANQGLIFLVCCGIAVGVFRNNRKNKKFKYEDTKENDRV